MAAAVLDRNNLSNRKSRDPKNRASKERGQDLSTSPKDVSAVVVEDLLLPEQSPAARADWATMPRANRPNTERSKSFFMGFSNKRGGRNPMVFPAIMIGEWIHVNG